MPDLEDFRPNDEEPRLFDRYVEATRLYAIAVTALSRQRGVSSQIEYRELREAAEDARLNCENARLAFQAFLVLNSRA